MAFSSVTWRATRPTTLHSLPHIVCSLSKAKLSCLVVSTMLCGHVLATSSPLSMSTMLLGTIGTGLCSASAAALNQWIEAPFDGQMKRTQCRLLPSLKILPPTALYVGTFWGVSGCSILYFLNAQASGLAFLTIALYAAIYTPLKRVTTLNTWIGAIVGAIPPLIGWALAGESIFDLKAWILPSVLFAWQFPHFNALSWRRREEYARAGYWMTAIVAPKANSLLSFAWAIILIPICGLAVWSGLEDKLFWFTSIPVNGLFAFRAYRFLRKCNDQTAGKLFVASLGHLPALMGLMLLCRKPLDGDHVDDTLKAT